MGRGRGEARVLGVRIPRQRRRVAVLDDVAVVEDEHAVVVGDRVDPVGDTNHGSVPERPADGPLNGRVESFVHSTRRLVEQQ